MYFSSKKDIWFFLIFWGFILFIIFFYIFGGEPFGWQIITYKSVPGYIISALMIGILLWMWFTTGYKIEKDMIEVKSGPFNSTIKIEEIKKINITKNPITAPALAIDRLEITYGKYKVIYVSPKKEREFLDLLLTINPRIQADLDTK